MLQTMAPPLWKQILRSNFTHIEPLADFLQLSDLQKESLLKRPNFSLNIPFRLANKMEKGSLEDPIFKQFVPTNEETIYSKDFKEDPVGDKAACKTNTLLHKYEGRVLLVCTSACAMHCRYCFRQNFDYTSPDKLFEKELELITEDSSINEVILSGGDPLSLDDRLLENLISRLSAIPQLTKLRFHSRFPIGIPERINENFLSLLSNCRLQIWFVVHINHPREIDDDILSALKSIQKLGIPVLNQSVLLKGINDNEEVLIELSNRLVNNGIFPYYLHQLDQVQGAAHFEVSESEGKDLIKQMAKKLPGYALPRYVREIAGRSEKTPI